MQTLTEEAINVAPAANVIAKFTSYLQLHKPMTAYCGYSPTFHVKILDACETSES